MSNPPEQHKEHTQSPVPQPLSRQHSRITRAGIISFLALIGLLILFSSSLLILGLIQNQPQTATTQVTRIPTQHTVPTSSKHATPTPVVTPSVNPDVTATITPPFVAPGATVVASLQLPSNRYVIYEQQKNLYIASVVNGTSQQLNAPGYIYNTAIRPVMTPSGQLLYSGEGIWTFDPFTGASHQIAPLAANQVITSLALSNDGTNIAWSTEPASGNGVSDIYAGPLNTSAKVYEQPVANCPPCFQVFAFINDTGKLSNTTLLLTDDQQSNEAIRTGLWSLDLTNPMQATPQQLLDETSEQGPLALFPTGNTLLYSPGEGEATPPTDNSVPADVATLNYANSLNITSLTGRPPTMSTPQTVVAQQANLNNIALQHWITTPIFSPDGHTLFYIIFSSDAQAPYHRHSALYSVQLSGTGTHLHAARPQLLLVSTATFVELGNWLDDHTLTFYSDGTIYAFDLQSLTFTPIIKTSNYARIVSVVGNGSAS